MNLRKEQLAELILKGIETMVIENDSVIVLRLPPGYQKDYTESIGQAVVNALRAIGKDNVVILIPDNLKIEQLSEEDMREMGWVKDAKPTERNTDMCGLQGSEKSREINEDQSKLRELWKNKVTELIKGPPDPRKYR